MKKTFAYASAPAYPDWKGNVPEVIIPLITGEPQSRRGKKQLKKAVLDGLEMLFDAKGNPRREDFQASNEDGWILIRKHADVLEGKRWVVYELRERT